MITTINYGLGNLGLVAQYAQTHWGKSVPLSDVSVCDTNRST